MKRAVAADMALMGGNAMPKAARSSILARILRKMRSTPTKAMYELDRLSRLPGICEIIDSGYRRTWRRAKCLFILSTGRAGTVTLVHLLNASEGISAYHEPVPKMLHERRSSYAECESKPERYRRLFTRARRRLIGRAHRSGKVYAEATPLQFFTPVIADMLPHAKFLHVYRHPGDFVRSGMRRGWYGNGPRFKTWVRPLPGDPAYEVFEDWDPFARLCWAWKELNEYVLRLSATMERGRVLAIPFEDLFQGPMESRLEACGRVFDFAGQPLPASEEAKSILGTRYNKWASHEFPRFEDWPDELRSRMDTIAGETMLKLGYAI